MSRRNSGLWRAAKRLPVLVAVVVVAAMGVRSARGASTVELHPRAKNLDVLLANASRLTESFSQISDSLADLLARVNTLPIAMPTEGLLSSEFAYERLHPIYKRTLPHQGIDVAAPMGTPVTVSAAGTVIEAGRKAGYGLMVEVDHGNGIVTRYAHLSRTFVKKGTSIESGMKIGAVGNSGLSTGPHLHYEILVNGLAVNPRIFLAE